MVAHDAPAADHRIEITRTFDAPRELVWRAWTEREHMLRWYCPEGFTVLFAEADVRVGGAWRSGMQSPDGRDYIHRGVYLEIDEPSRLVFTHTWEKSDVEPPAETTVTVTLTERGGRTTMRFEQEGFATDDSGQSHHEGWTGAFDNLARHLVGRGR